jgi:hypothetical protein
MKFTIAKSAVVCATLLCANGCAYFRPSEGETENERLAEQKAIQEQTQFRDTLVGCLMDTAVQIGAAFAH